MREVFDKLATYDVFVKGSIGGGKMIVLAERERKGYSDGIYEHSSQGTVRQLLTYEISSKGMMNQQWVNRAVLRKYGYLGQISGYGANAYMNEKGGIKQFIREFGKPAKKKGFLRKIMGILFG